MEELRSCAAEGMTWRGPGGGSLLHCMPVVMGDGCV